jgi:DDE family transposase
MEQELFIRLLRVIRRIGRRRLNGKQRYTDGTIFAVHAWAALNDRPVLWACRRKNWPKSLWRGPMPSQSQVSRRLRTKRFERVARRIEHAVLRAGRRPTLAFAVDGKPLPIAAHSTDRQAGYGRAVGGKAKGYKLHALIDLNGVVWAWRVTPMNKDERPIARRMLREVPAPGYLLADANYDSNVLFEQAADLGVQPIIPRRYGPNRGVGHRAQHPARLHSRDMLETPGLRFGPALLKMRLCVERFFSRLTARAGGLTCLPAWVRTHRRVHQWVRAKLIFYQIHADMMLEYA